MSIINWLHVLIIAPLFIYVGHWYDTHSSWVYYLLGLVGGIVVFYHGSKVLSAGIINAFFINILHAFLIGPILIAFAIYANAVPTWLFTALLLLGFSAFGYHLRKILI